MKEIIIIGGGAAGVTAAIAARRKNYNVTLLEKNSQLGKKLRITGNGRCNYYNDDQNEFHYHSNDKSLVKEIISSKNLEKVSTFFTSIGIIPKIKDGYYYPFSNQAISIVSALTTEAKKLGVDIKLEVEVKQIEKKEHFLIDTNQGQFKADKVIIATGGMSYKKTGSDGFGYHQLKKLGHSINKPLPGLSALITEESFPKEWKGIRTEASIKLLENNQLIREEQGEVQLTADGISGICAMQLSSYIAKGLSLGKREEIRINFLPFLSNEDDWMKFIKNRNNTLKNRTLIELLEGIINYKLIQAILKKEQNLKWDQLSEKEQKEIGKKLLSYQLIVKDIKSFDYAQTTLGGVPLSEINLKTMESSKIKDLYIIGELLDLTGDCGGYNLTIAWISGLCAGENI